MPEPLSEWADALDRMCEGLSGPPWPTSPARRHKEAIVAFANRHEVLRAALRLVIAERRYKETDRALVKANAASSFGTDETPYSDHRAATEALGHARDAMDAALERAGLE